MNHKPPSLGLPPRQIDDPDPHISALLVQAKNTVGMIPNMYANMANAPGLLAAYMSGYSDFRSESGFDRVEQELVFLVISERNQCEYCMAAHSFVADLAGVPPHVTDTIREAGTLDDQRLEALATFTRHLFDTRGRPTREHIDSFLAAGYTERHMLYLVLALAVKTLSNYTNHLFDTPLDAAFGSREWRP